MLTFVSVPRYPTYPSLRTTPALHPGNRSFWNHGPSPTFLPGLPGAESG